MKLVLVVWEDASIMDDGPWTERESARPHEPTIFHQVGWLYSLDSEAVVLTAAVSDKLMAPRDRIPVGMVKQLLELEPESGAPVPIPKKRRTK